MVADYVEEQGGEIFFNYIKKFCYWKTISLIGVFITPDAFDDMILQVGDDLQIGKESIEDMIDSVCFHINAFYFLTYATY